MRWIYLGLFLCYYEALCVGSLRKKRAADLTQDDWPDERPGAAEIERLVREKKENRDLLASIPSRYYEIIYPVQRRHSENVGISTRDVSANKTGKHFHHTSLLIKAFNHKLRLDLELNTNLLAPHLIQKHFLPGELQHLSSQVSILERLFTRPYDQLEIEHCYYHGTINDSPGAFAAFRTCNGVSGIIHIGNETFVIHPFYGGDLSKKHPHVIYEAKNKMKQACGNTRNLEWGFVQYRKHDDKRRYKRDVREVTKYVELALVVDRNMFHKRNTTNRIQVVHDVIQVANIVDMYFNALNTRVSIVYLETWGEGDQIVVSSDVRSALMSFMEYCSRKLYKISKDSTQLLTGLEFRGGEAGMAVPDSICTAKAVGVSKDINIYEPHLVAVSMAHAIGHNMGMAHDDSKCQCPDWHGCIMEESIVTQETVQPYRFSSCSLRNFVASLRSGHGICLFNKPNQLEDFRTCGNGVVDNGEDCDCGTMLECPIKDPCCDPITCKLKAEAECSTGPCCDKCKLREAGHLCRASRTECDIPEFCDGKMGQCPSDTYKKNGNRCTDGKGYCYLGSCPTRDRQCDYIWGGGKTADEKCFEQFNQQGSFNGNCGVDINGSYRKCDAPNVLCGSLQCKGGSRIPIVQGLSEKYTRTIVSIGGDEFECKVTSGKIQVGTDRSRDMGLIWDGTKCGDNKICVNQTCVIVKLFTQMGRCPTNNVALDCSGNGACSNVNTCFCDEGWAGDDCSKRTNRTAPQTIPPVYPVTSLPEPSQASTTQGMSETISNWQQITTKNISYVNSRSSDTPLMVASLVSVVGGVFVAFALLAVCYRRRSTLPRYDPPYMKKPIVRKIPVKVGSKEKEEETSVENANRIITFGSMPSYRYRPDDKMQEMKRQRFKRDKGEDDEDGVEEDETVSFIELPPNNLSKLPEKGILKNMPKAEGGSDKDKWGDEMSQSDNQEVLSQSDAAGERSSDVLTEVERTLKSMNGYHEDILEALRNAASHRGSSQSNLTEELRKSLSDGIPDFSMGILKGSGDKLNDSSENVEDTVPPCGPIRIRNLEDLIRQLERHPSRHMSPAGSEDIRFSETEADRHYRQELGESQRCTLEPDSARFVFGRFRQPTVAERSHKGSRGEDVGGSYGRQRAAAYEERQVEPEVEEVENGEFVCKHLMRSASEEALSSSVVKREHSFERNLNSGHHEKTLKGQTFDYFPSPPSEDSYPDSYEENASFPAPSVSSGSRSGSNDQVFLERQGRSDRRDRAAAGDSKGKVKYKEYAH